MPYLANLLENNFDELRDMAAEEIFSYEKALINSFGEDTHSLTEGKNSFRLYFAERPNGITGLPSFLFRKA